VRGAEAVQPASMGVYTKMANLTQGDRPVYQRVGSVLRYLYYLPVFGNTRWFIGEDYFSTVAAARSSAGGWRCPDQAPGWEVYDGIAWVGTYVITVAWAATAPPANAGNAPARPSSHPWVLTQKARERTRVVRKVRTQSGHALHSAAVLVHTYPRALKHTHARTHPSIRAY
jgi:hypothetical protein